MAPKLIKEIFVEGNRGYKSKKPNSRTVNILEPVAGIKLLSDTMYGQGDDMVFLHPDGFKFPVSRRNFNLILNNVTIVNGVINEFMAIVDDTNSFSLIPGLSTQYNELREKYDTENNKKTNKISLKEMEIGDSVVIARGKTIEKGYIYLGAVYILPFSIETNYYRDNLEVYIGGQRRSLQTLQVQFPKPELEKRFLFVKLSGNKNLTDFFMFSSFPTVIEKTEGGEIDTAKIFDEIDSNLQSKLLRWGSSGLGEYYLKSEKTLKYESRWNKNFFIANSDKIHSLTCYPEEVSFKEAYEKTISHFGDAIRYPKNLGNRE